VGNWTSVLSLIVWIVAADDFAAGIAFSVSVSSANYMVTASFVNAVSMSVAISLQQNLSSCERFWWWFR